VNGVFVWGVKVMGRLVADADSEFGVTELLGSSSGVRPFTVNETESRVTLVTPSETAALRTFAGTVKSADRVVWKVPGAVILDGGDGVSDTTTGSVVVRTRAHCTSSRPTPIRR